MNKKEKNIYNKEIKNIVYKFKTGEVNLKEAFSMGSVLRDRFFLEDRAILDSISKDMVKYENEYVKFKKLISKKSSISDIKKVLENQYFLVSGMAPKINFKTPLAISIENKRHDVIEELFKKGAEPYSGNFIYKIFEMNDIETFQMFLNYKYDPEKIELEGGDVYEVIDYFKNYEIKSLLDKHNIENKLECQKKEKNKHKVL